MNDYYDSVGLGEKLIELMVVQINNNIVAKKALLEIAPEKKDNMYSVPKVLN